jgi:hypothetical protein
MGFTLEPLMAAKKNWKGHRGRLILGGLFGFLEKNFFLIFCNNFFSKKKMSEQEIQQ